jgi:hypothetical protein
MILNIRKLTGRKKIKKTKAQTRAFGYSEHKICAYSLAVLNADS